MSCLALDPQLALDIIDKYGYWLVFITGIGEALPLIGMFVPGHVIILVAGAAAGYGLLDLWWVFGLALVSGIIGDVPGFYVGRRYGKGAIETLTLRFPILGKAVGKSAELFDRRGEAALVLCRFSFVTRAIGPLLSGASRMTWRTFWVYNILGALAWAILNVFGGYFFGLGFLAIQNVVGQALGLALLAAIAIFLGYRSARRLFRGK